MKIKEMSWEELERDFSKLLDKYTSEELVNSLDKYSIDYCLEKEQFEMMTNIDEDLNKKSVKLDSILYNKVDNKENRKIEGERLWKGSLISLPTAA